MGDGILTVCGGRFWDLWLMKILRNISSMKFISMVLVYSPIVILMFSGSWVEGAWVSKVSTNVGVPAITGGLVTLILGRVYADTRLRHDDEVKKGAE